MSITETLVDLSNGMSAWTEGYRAGYFAKGHDNPYSRGWSRLGIETGRVDLARKYDDGYQTGCRQWVKDWAAS